MSSVWVFDKKGVVRRVEIPGVEQSHSRRKVLVHVPSNEIITSYEMLEQKLAPLGWERYHHNHPELVQFHMRTSVHLISLPRDFSRLTSVHMYDIVVKSRNVFEVRDE